MDFHYEITIPIHWIYGLMILALSYYSFKLFRKKKKDQALTVLIIVIFLFFMIFVL